MARNGTAVLEQLNNVFNRDMSGGLEAIQMEMASIRIGQRYDIFMGGLVGNRKFPSTPLLEVSRCGAPICAPARRNSSPAGLRHHEHSILMGGLYDHVGGGFFRYTNDERWQVPHFEKSLSDNALLVDFMTQMWQFNRNELCRMRVPARPYRLALRCAT